ncbi:MAG TPA: hypothetical protein VFX74_04255 [Candidatus Limnocylindria bacterium]|nr:hypothetical protein [Candidatus Limnocylindria bacterium]
MNTAATKSRATGALLTAAIVTLALTTGYIHSTLGGLLFTLNALGYAAAAVAIVIGAAAPHPFIARFSWLPRLGLIGYAATTIGAWVVMGPYFSTAYIAKAVEVGLITLLVVDSIRVYGSPMGMIRQAFASVFGRSAELARA